VIDIILILGYYSNENLCVLLLSTYDLLSNTWKQSVKQRFELCCILRSPRPAAPPSATEPLLGTLGRGFVPCLSQGGAGAVAPAEGGCWGRRRWCWVEGGRAFYEAV